MTVSLPLGGKGTGQFVHNVMFVINENKKQIEELNSSQIKETLFSFKEKATFLQNLCCQDILSNHQYYLATERLLEETSEMFTALGRTSCDLESGTLTDVSDFSVQSDEIIRESTAAETTEQVTTTFDSSEDVITAMSDVTGNWYKPTNTANSDISEFLNRPVKIQSYTWTIGNSVDESFRPWQDYFGTTSIQNKLHNYAFLRCDMHIKIMINASPFYYGALLGSYNPLFQNYSSANVDGSSDILVPFSQRAHVYLYPQECTTAEMILPYLNNTEWIDVHGQGGTTKLTQMGTFHLDSIGVLLNANGVSGENINIEIYAWAENVQLAGLTVDLAVQSDEYSSKGPISKTASAIARGSGMLSGFPVIGKYMTATSVASGAIASIAASFGFTKVPVLDKIQAFKNLPFHGLATSDQSDVTEKLTVDSKNELSIDNSVIGDTNPETLLISNFVQRASYLTTFTWQSSDASDSLLWNMFVSPVAFASTAGTGQTLINGTPMFLASQMFQYWRGDIIFDIKVVCTKYHRGRLRFSWDPVGDVANTANSTSMVFNHIMDITDGTEVSLRIPFIQRTSYLSVPESLTTTYYGTSPLAAGSEDIVNGIFTARVLNEQSSPVSTADITIIVSVRGAENLEFAAPRQIDTDLNFYTVQSEEITMGAPSSVDPKVNLIYMGETVVSFRELMQRCNHTVSWSDVIPTSQSEYHSSLFSRRPLYRGFDPNGVHTATGIVSAAPAPFNFVTTSPYHLLTSCFLGERGSITWKVNADSTQTKSLEATRSDTILDNDRYNPSDSSNTFNITALSASGNAKEFSERSLSNLGMALVNQLTNTGLSFNAPMYSIYTMLPTSPALRTQGKSLVSSTDSVQVSWITHESTHDEIDFEVNHFYFQCGPDHSLVYFNNVPTLYKYSSPVTP